MFTFRSKTIILLLLSLVFALALLELGSYALLSARGFYRASSSPRTDVVGGYPDNVRPNARYGWAYIPQSHYLYTNPAQKHSFDVRINSESFRDEEPAERDGADFKFMALGDSFTFGWLVEENERWDEALKSLIEKAAAKKTASINRGMWMSTFDQHALILEDNFAPCDLIVHLVYPSHLQTLNRHTDVIENGKITKAVDPLTAIDGTRLSFASDGRIWSKKLYAPFTFCALQYAWDRLVFKRAFGPRFKDLDHELIYQKQGEQSFSAAYALLETSIRQIAAFAKARKVPYLVVIVPAKIQVSSAGWEGRAPVEEILTGDLPQQRIKDICARADGTLCLDLLPAFRLNASSGLYYHADPHWTPAGHALAAAQIRAYLRAQKIGPGLS